MDNISTNISITGSTLNQVQGNQFNNSNNKTTVIHGNFIRNKTVINTAQQLAGSTEYDEFRRVTRGDVIVLQDLYSQDLSHWEWNLHHGLLMGRLKALQTAQTIMIYPDKENKFTAVKYEGKEGKDVWEQDFRRFSRTRDTYTAQLFGINQSEIPMLIFHHELIPSKNFYKRSLWMDLYVSQVLASHSSLHRLGISRIWMDTQRGVLCIGPEGPDVPFWPRTATQHAITNAPLTVDMLHGDTFISFFRRYGPKVDAMVLDFASKLRNWLPILSFYEYSQECKDPGDAAINIDVDALRFDTVYSPLFQPVARCPRESCGPRWKVHGTLGLDFDKVMPGRLLRLRLLLPAPNSDLLISLGFDRENALSKAWLSQSSRFCDTLESTHESFAVIVQPSFLSLSGRRDCARARACYNNLNSPIYLFLRPPETIEDLVSLRAGIGYWKEGVERRYYFWSLDKNGRSELTDGECRLLGLPRMVAREQGWANSPQNCALISWSAPIYTGIRDWQRARGFDPSTADWARSMGYPELEVLKHRYSTSTEGRSERRKMHDPCSLAEPSCRSTEQSLGHALVHGKAKPNTGPRGTAPRAKSGQPSELLHNLRARRYGVQLKDLNSDVPTTRRAVSKANAIAPTRDRSSTKRVNERTDGGISRPQWK